MSKAVIDDEGRILLSHQVSSEIGAAKVDLIAHSPNHLLFAAQKKGESVIMAGLVGELAVTDLLSFFNMFRKTGMLRFDLKGGSKDLYFQQGEIVFATSTFPEEDLGEVLCGLGKIDYEGLKRARKSLAGRSTVGKLLVEQGSVTPKDLWQATRHQVESIVYNLFAFDTGSYVFVSRELENADIVRLSMSTQNLIMEGLRRVDERELFMRSIRSFDAVPVTVPEKVEDLPPAEKRMALLIGDRREQVREVLRRSGMGEFEALRILYQLVEKKAVKMQDAPSLEMSGDLAKILSIFNGALNAISRRLSEKNPSFAKEVDTFLHDLPQPFSFVFRDVSLQEDGTIEGGRILANLGGLDDVDKKKLLADALSELVYMECMAARRELGATESAELIQRVQDISRRVKNIIGGKE